MARAPHPGDRLERSAAGTAGDSAQAAFAPQASVFVAVFVLLGIVNAWAYAMLASGARTFIRRPAVLRAATRTGAVFLIGAGVASAVTRRGG